MCAYKLPDRRFVLPIRKPGSTCSRATSIPAFDFFEAMTDDSCHSRESQARKLTRRRRQKDASGHRASSA